METTEDDEDDIKKFIRENDARLHRMVDEGKKKIIEEEY